MRLLAAAATFATAATAITAATAAASIGFVIALTTPALATPTRADSAPLSCPTPTNLPHTRRGGGLTVTSPPLAPPKAGGSRLRFQITGTLAKAHTPRDERKWAGPEVPLFVPLTSGTKELFLLDAVGDRYLAFYRDPYGESTCKGDGYPNTDVNCAFEARIFSCDGATVATFQLDKLLSKRTGLEIQDIHLVDNVLYFNEACGSYSTEQGGTCSALVALDIRDGRTLWRTKHLISNNVFLVVGGYILTGYGFTKEPSSLFLVRRTDGVVVAQQPIKKVAYAGGHHDSLTLLPDNIVRVGIYDQPGDLVVKLVGIEGAKPSFEMIKDLEPVVVPKPQPLPSP